MKTNKINRFFLFALSFLIMMNSFGVFVYTYIGTAINREIKYASVHKDINTSLSLNKDEFSSIAWIGSRDFIYKGKVYDCAGISTKKGRIIIMCSSDEAETNFKNSLASNFQEPNTKIPSSKSSKDIFKSFPVFCGTTTSSQTMIEGNLAFEYSQYSSLFPTSADLSLTSPPPKFS